MSKKTTYLILIVVVLVAIVLGFWALGEKKEVIAPTTEQAPTTIGIPDNLSISDELGG